MKGEPYARIDRRKPTLGYPSRIDAIRALRAEGKNAPEIAEMIGVHVGTVYSLESQQKKRDRYSSAFRREVDIPEPLWDDLERIARRRKVPVTRLIERLLFSVVTRKLEGAVLDR